MGVTGIHQPVNLQARGSHFLRFVFRLLKIGKGFFKISEVKIGESKISRGRFNDAPAPESAGQDERLH